MNDPIWEGLEPRGYALEVLFGQPRELLVPINAHLVECPLENGPDTRDTLEVVRRFVCPGRASRHGCGSARRQPWRVLLAQARQLRLQCSDSLLGVFILRPETLETSLPIGNIAYVTLPFFGNALEMNNLAVQWRSRLGAIPSGLDGYTYRVTKLTAEIDKRSCLSQCRF